MNFPAHLLHVFPSFGEGGTELRVVRIINSLGPAFRHSIMALNGRFDAARRIEPHIAVASVAAPAGRGPLFPLALRRTLQAARPHLLLTYNWGAFDAVLAAAWKPFCPIIHNESGFGPDEAQGLKRRRVLTRRLLLKRIHATVVNSRTLIRIATGQYRVPPAKLRFIRNGVDTARFCPGRNCELRAALGAGDGLLFGFLGNHRREKNLALLVRAFHLAALPGAKLVLFGDGGCRGELEALCSELGIAACVLFPGQIQDSAAHLRALDVFVMSSDTEQTPNALLEAMACGLPVVSTHVGDIPELLDQSGAPVLVPARDAGAMAAAFKNMAANPELRAALGAGNRRRCLEHYSHDRMVAEFHELYRSALG